MTDDGARLLDHVRDQLVKYAAFPSEHAVTAVTLWIVATHAVSVWEHATRLAVHSPVKRCGKSRLLEIVEALVHQPIATTNISVAALFRMIDKGADRPPTLILDEADRLFGSVKKDEENSDLIALLNNGFRPGRPTIRCVGPSQVPTEFRNFAMVAIAGIGRLPDTIEDRAVNITMRRRLPGQKVAKFRLRTDLPELHEVRDWLADWAEQHLAKLADPVDDLPADLEDRAQDAWEPLLAVADVAGGTWPARGRAAALALAADAADSDGEQSLEIRLLADIRAIFGDLPHVGFLGTSTLLTKLREIEDAPWHDFEFTARKLALRLAKFEIGPRHNTTKTERGYHLEDFRDVFPRYLPSEPSAPVQLPAEQAELPDGSYAPDGSTRPADFIRPDETAGQTSNGRVRTVRTDSPWPDGSVGAEANR
ncbi:MAG TPA: DUF3631 domain-containing protein [Streptosporangiaceae bacterium]|jgi:hypothetical protein